MAREITYQSVGNPLQFARLPKHRPDLAMRYLPFASRDDARFAFELLGSIAAFGAIAVVGRLLAVFAGGRFHFVWPNLIPAAVVFYFLGRAFQELDGRWLRLPLAFVAVVTVYLQLPLPAFVHLALAAAAVGALTWQFASHWTAFCTASPLEKATAQKLQQRWRGYVAGMAVVPAIVVLLSAMSTGLSLTMGGAFVLLQIAECLRARPSIRSLSVAWRAVVSWLTYDRHDIRPPGVLRSPAGPWPVRMAAIGLCAAVLAAAVVDFIQRSFQITVTEGSLIGCLQSIAGGNFLWLVILGLIPATLTFAIPLVLTLPLLSEAERRRASQVTAYNWQHLVDEVQNSPDHIERQCIYMGQVVHDGTPLLVPRTVYGEHAHFLGDSGGGKTSLGLCPLMEQLGISGDCSIIVVDLKADAMELFATLEATADKARQRTGRTIPLKHFTNQTGRSTFAFNLLRYPYWRNLDLYTRTDILCGALGLTYGADYGEGYYSSANAAVLHYTHKLFPDVSTYRELGERVGYVAANAKAGELHPEVRKAGVHVKMVLDRLGSFPALNVAPGSGHAANVLDHAIDFTEVFQQPQFHYFHLSSTLAPGASPEIARLVTYSLLAAATQVERKCQVYLVIDEFQRMVARNLEYMLQLARSMGVGVILANQTMQDLRTSTADLIPAIEANCRYRQWFAVSSKEDRERLIEASGQTVDYLITKTMNRTDNGVTESVAHSEFINHRLTVNDVLLASDHPRRSIVRVSRGEGYAQYGGMPLVVESDYHISKSEYERRKNTPWPEGVAGSFVPTLAAPYASGSQPARPGPGPVVTTEVIGQPAPAGAAAPDPLAHFVPPTKSQRGKPRRNNP